MSAALSNRLAHLGAEIHRARGDFARHTESATQAALAAGAALIEAKSLCPRGGWRDFLRQTGLTERTAQRWMRLARSGLKPAIVADLGGVAEAERFLAWARTEGIDTDPQDLAECIVEGRYLRDLTEAELARHIEDRIAALAGGGDGTTV